MNVLVHQVAGRGPPGSGSLLFLRCSTISHYLNYGLSGTDPWLPVCGLALSCELLTWVCNRRPENSTWVSHKQCWLNLSETRLGNFLSKLVFSSQGRPPSPGSLMPRTWVCFRTSLYRSPSCQGPGPARCSFWTRPCAVHLSSSPHWQLPRAKPSVLGCSLPGPLLTWALAHLGPLLTWAPYSPGPLAQLGCYSPGPLFTSAPYSPGPLAHLGSSLLQGLLSFSVFATTQPEWSIKNAASQFWSCRSCPSFHGFPSFIS